jgi:hypothetical protein
LSETKEESVHVLMGDLCDGVGAVEGLLKKEITGTRIATTRPAKTNVKWGSIYFEKKGH